MAKAGDVRPKLAAAQSVVAHILTCAKFSQWPFQTAPHAMTYAQMVLLLLAQRGRGGEERPLPARFWAHRRDQILAAMRQSADGAK